MKICKRSPLMLSYEFSKFFRAAILRDICCFWIVSLMFYATAEQLSLDITPQYKFILYYEYFSVYCHFAFRDNNHL